MRDLTKDKEMCDKATPGPWIYDGMHQEITVPQGKDYWLIISECRPAPDQQYGCDKFNHQFDANFAFIAAAREGWPEAIDRAIKADHQNECHIETILQLKDEKASLTEEHDIQRAGIQELSRQVVGYREGLSRIEDYIYTNFPHGLEKNRYVMAKTIRGIVRGLLATPDSGAKYRKEMELVVKIADAAVKRQKSVHGSESVRGGEVVSLEIARKLKEEADFIRTAYEQEVKIQKVFCKRLEAECAKMQRVVDAAKGIKCGQQGTYQTCHVLHCQWHGSKGCDCEQLFKAMQALEVEYGA